VLLALLSLTLLFSPPHVLLVLVAFLVSKLNSARVPAKSSIDQY